MPDASPPDPLAYATPPGLDPREPTVAVSRETGLKLGEVLIVAALLLSGFGLFAYFIQGESRPADRVTCLSHLRVIGQCLTRYTDANEGGYPKGFADLIAFGECPPNYLVCPVAPEVPATGATPAQQAAAFRSGPHGSYTYIAPTPGVALSPRTVIAFDTHTHNRGGTSLGINVLYADGHAASLNNVDSKYLIAELAAGYNPPRSLPAVTPSASAAGR